MSSNKFLLVVVAVIVFSFSKLCLALVPQYSQFFPIDTCNGPHVYTLDTVADFQNFSKQAVHGITQRGLWDYTYVVREGVTSTFTMLDATSSTCRIFINGITIVSAERVLNSDLDSPEIAFYSGSHYNGTRVIINQTEYKFPQQMTVESYAFTGTQSWTVFSNKDFYGQRITCLKPNENDPFKRGYQITGASGIFTPLLMRIGSVRLGCDGEVNSIISHDTKNSQPTSINGNVISTTVIDYDKNEERTVFTQ